MLTSKGFWIKMTEGFQKVIPFLGIIYKKINEKYIVNIHKPNKKW